MKGFALIFRPDGGAGPGELHTFNEPPTLQFMRDAVGGDIELVPGFDSIGGRRCVAFCNDDGKRDLPMNDTATALWEGALFLRGERRGLIDAQGHLVDWLAGPVLVLYGDDEFMAEL